MCPWKNIFGGSTDESPSHSTNESRTSQQGEKSESSSAGDSAIIGIDLGTSNTCAAVMLDGRPVIIPNLDGGRTTPSVVSFRPEGVLVGQSAKRQSIINPMNTVFSIKRLVGRSSSEVSRETRKYPYKLYSKHDVGLEVGIGDRRYTPVEISAYILKYIHECTEHYLGRRVNHAVVTVPSYFNDCQRRATRDAARIAGFEVARIVNESTAASMACSFNEIRDRTIAVCHFGGGTFGVSIIETGDNVDEVKSTCGDNDLGGDDFDQKVLDWLIVEFGSEHRVDLSKDAMALQRLKEAAERAKCELSIALQTEIALPFITAGSKGPMHLKAVLTRDKFERMTTDLLERIAEPCNQALKDANLSVMEIDEVVMVGGTTRIPEVQKRIAKIFGRDPYYRINPDEGVAMGAAILGGVLSGSVYDMLLLDVTPFSLGIETLGGVVTQLIVRNTTIPTRKSEIFSTTEDNQKSVEIRIFQGEKEMACQNRMIGRFVVGNIPPAPKGVPQIEVTFDIDAGGILRVSAKDIATNKERSIIVDSAARLSDGEISRLAEKIQISRL